MDALPTYLTGFLAVLLLSSFVKMVTTLSILRYGIGLTGAGFGLAIVGVALALSLFVMHPQLEAAGGLDAVLNKQSSNSRLQIEQKFRPFIEKHTDATIKARLSALASKLTDRDPERSTESQAKLRDPFPVLITAFLVSELKEAFYLGFIILIPFLVIDLLVTNVLMALGVTQISQAVVSLPLKILLFFAVDGWTMVSEKLIGGYV